MSAKLTAAVPANDQSMATSGYQASSVHGSTLDAPAKLLCAVVRGIIERKDLFVLELQVSRQQDSLLEKLKEIARKKHKVIVNERTVQAAAYVLEPITVTLLELKHVP